MFITPTYLGQQLVDILVVGQEVGNPGVVAGAAVGELPKGSGYRVHCADEDAAGVDVIIEGVGKEFVARADLGQGRADLGIWGDSIRSACKRRTGQGQGVASAGHRNAGGMCVSQKKRRKNNGKGLLLLRCRLPHPTSHSYS